MPKSFSDEEIKLIQTCIIKKDFNLAAFHILNKSMLENYPAEEKLEQIERLAFVLEDTSPYWPDLKMDIIRIIVEKFTEGQ
ncbi:MAG: hypothetical protein K0R51_438 [Cytophagaceae bacterium]|jgi:hypothetical protein|nr:hypothetical protein [Cytophagaceae bacterium]